MKVKITKAKRPTFWYADNIGKTYDVKQDYTWENQYHLLNDNNKLIRHEDCEVVTELTKEEALKLCIDGAKVTGVGTVFPKNYVFFNGKLFMYHDDCKGVNEEAKEILNIKRWKLWTHPEPPKPKFSKGQFVTDEVGDWLRVFDLEYSDDSYKYYVSCGSYDNSRDKCEVISESELTEVSNGN